jgi:hypothetical protein
VACSILDGGDEIPQAFRALKPARVAKQGAQLATFLYPSWFVKNVNRLLR